MKVKRIITEEIQDFLNTEGVADKYAEKAFNMPDPNVEMDRKAMQGIKPEDTMGEYVGDATSEYGKEKLSKIYRNPKSLKNFDVNVRALSDLEGNLYIGQLNKGYYHSRISQGVNDGGKYQLPYAYDANKLIQWHRINDSNDFGYSISYSDYYNGKTYEALQAIKAVQDKNPQFRFHPVYWDRMIDGQYNPELTDLNKLMDDEKKLAGLRHEIQTNPRYSLFKGVNTVRDLKFRIKNAEEMLHQLNRMSQQGDYGERLEMELKKNKVYLILAKELQKKFDDTLNTPNVEESVADRAYERIFGMTNQEKELNRQATMGMDKDTQISGMGTYAGDVYDSEEVEADGSYEVQSRVYANPQSLEEFEAGVRAFSGEDGNLFVAQFNGNFWHRDIGYAVKEYGKFGQIGNVDMPRNYIQWERVESTDIFGFSPTYWQYLETSIEMNDTVFKETAKKFVAAAQQKNPNLKMIPMYSKYIEKGYYNVETGELKMPDK